jgi:hypothetical protein
MLSRGRRRRGPSLFHVVYLGTHPVALMMSAVVSILPIVILLGWVMLVACVWPMWAACVTVGWLCQAGPHDAAEDVAPFR